MTKSNILFISTNPIWSGSEELWYQSALKYLKESHRISIITHYKNDKIQFLVANGAQHLVLESPKYSKNRYINRIVGILKKNNNSRSVLKRIDCIKINIAVISQGNNIDSSEIMLELKNSKIPFVTISQLVSEVHWLFLDDKKQRILNELYKYSTKNYFLSIDNLKIHQMMMSDFDSKNNEIIYNPINCSEILSDYPDNTNQYRLAFVGRIECFHKGLDILFEILRKDKWKNRNLVVTLYGNGPHKKSLERFVEQNNLTNIHFKEFTNNVNTIWEDNHGLILPSRMEGQSLSLLEALHCERMVITTNVGGASEVIIDNKTGFISPSFSIFDLENTMERAWSKRDIWKEMGVDARKLIKEKMPIEASEHFMKLINHEITFLRKMN